MTRPIIAITMGDAAGVGPEVIMKSLAHPELHEQCRPLVIGDATRLQEAGRIVGSTLAVRSLAPAELEKALFARDTVDCIDLKLIPVGLPWGAISISNTARFVGVTAASGMVPVIEPCSL